jgi:predicted nucleic acid-binding Zn ribbon protein
MNPENVPDASANCLVCGKPLEQRDSGRPRWYCATACKRVAEYERRRRARRQVRRQGGSATVAPPRRGGFVTVFAATEEDVHYVDGDPVPRLKP